jgi:hypothetical protein
MNLIHKSKSEGIPFDSLVVGQVYRDLMPSSRLLVYMACTNPGHNGKPKVDFLLNMETGCRVVPSITRQYGFKHLPNATLNTGE